MVANSVCSSGTWLAHYVFRGPPITMWPVETGLDDTLVERIRARDEKALRVLIERFGPSVYAATRRVVAEPFVVEEIAQDTFLMLWRRPEVFDPGRGSLQAFLAAVARNKAVDLVRKEAPRRRAAQALRDEAESASKVTLGDERIEGVEERQGIRDALARLSPVQREAIVLAYFGGRTYREVAEELDIPEGTAKTRLRDGLIKLRALMTLPRGSE
jgi:RNA polymerase sigma-70 factor, ECF subfamily